MYVRFTLIVAEALLKVAVNLGSPLAAIKSQDGMKCHIWLRDLLDHRNL